MRKLFKIILVIFAIVIVSFVALASIVVLDVAGTLATDTHPLPNGAPTGQALVVYDPGLSGVAKDVATKIGYNLQNSGYNVVLAGVSSSTAKDISSYNVIVVGGPIYAGKPAQTIQTYLSTLSPAANQKVGVFGSGSVTVDNSNSTAVAQDVANLPSGSPITLSAAVKITSSSDVNAECQSFVSRLLA